MAVQIIVRKKQVKRYARIPHDVERKDDTFMTDGVFRSVRSIVIERQKRLPEVYRVYPLHHVLLMCPLQFMWLRLNPMLSPDKWATLLDDTLMLCNGTGFPSRWNCVANGGKPPPKPSDNPAFDQARLFGGCIKEVTVQGDKVWLKSMLTSDPVRSTDEIMSDLSYWHYATSVGVNGSIMHITRVGMDGKRHKVIIPHITAEPTYLPLKEVDLLPAEITPKDFPDNCELFHWLP